MLARNRRQISAALVAGLVATMAPAVCYTPASGQWSTPTRAESARFQLPETVEVPLADREVRRRLEQADAFAQQHQFAEALAIYHELLLADPPGVLAIAPTRLVGTSQWIRIRLAALPPEALAKYRQQVDPVARREFDDAIERRDDARLRRLLTTYPLSHYAGSAMDALAQMALDRGELEMARRYWEPLVPAPDTPRDAGRPTWFHFPDADLSPADVRARLVLVSILEQDAERATSELTAFRSLHPQARGILGGLEQDLGDALQKLLESSRSWPTPTDPRATPDWPTLAGSEQRQRILPPLLFGGTAWQQPLPQPAPVAVGEGARSIAEAPEEPLSYFPVIWNDIVLIATATQILAYRLEDGRPAWGDTAVIYTDPDWGSATGEGASASSSSARALHAPDSLTPPRFTLTVANDRLYARMGPTATSRPDATDWSRVRPASLVCLDLKEEGRLRWTTTPGDPRSAWEGAPVADAARVYVALRRTDVRSQVDVACLDAENGELLWRTHVCGSETPQQGRLSETTQDLLTRHGATLFYNTQAGAVAALDCETGRIEWMNLYPREREGSLRKLAPHWSRALTPAVYAAGRLYVAPRDARGIFCFDAHDGRLLWQTPLGVDDAVHLLGVMDNRLFASGDRLYAIEATGPRAGEISAVWPDGPSPIGFGRGLLTEGRVVLPTRDALVVVDAATLTPVEQWPLAPMGVTSGNLAASRGTLVIAGGKTLAVLRRRGSTP